MSKIRLLPILTILLLNIHAFCQSQVEKEVYKQVLEEFVLSKLLPNSGNTEIDTILVRKKPWHNIPWDKDSYSWVKSQYKKLEIQTFLDFVSKAKTEFEVSNLSFPNIKVTVVEKDFASKWNITAEDYPSNYTGILEFSNIGFNETKTQAILYYGYIFGPMVGGGVYFIYKKKKNRWKRKKTLPAWAS